MAPPTLGTIPPTLPPSVEEAYRRKCIQLKQRTNAVEEGNDVMRLRLVRRQRSIHKMRIERAFLLEQLAKRTSTNVEDSEGSPSPPPTPKEKPLRIKRGHRKPSFLNSVGDGRAGGSFAQQGPVTLSPSSDVFSHGPMEGGVGVMPQGAQSSMSSKRPLPLATPTNGHASNTPPPRSARTPFELFCDDLRHMLTVEHRQEIALGTFNVDHALATRWNELDTASKDEYERRLLSLRRQSDVDREAAEGAAGARLSVFDPQRRETMDRDEDVEMADETEESAGAGFTAINRG